MKAYIYDDKGYFDREDEAQIDPLETKIKGEYVYIMPANSTTLEPLEPKEGYRVKWGCEQWEYEEIIVPLEPESHIQTDEEQRQNREYAYIAEVDPITSHISRLRDQDPIPEEEIAELIAERDAKVSEIKERYPYKEV